MDNTGIIIFYDGYCALCIRIVRFVLRKDKAGVFYFASLQSEFAKKTIPEKFTEEYNTLVLKSGNQILVKSSAAFTILSKIPTSWRILNIFSSLPVSFTDKIYDLIARFRYRIFGKYETCPLPQDEHKDKFID